MANDVARDSNAGAVLARWQALADDAAAHEIFPCCGSRAWAQAVATRRPFASVADLFAASDEVWGHAIAR